MREPQATGTFGREGETRLLVCSARNEGPYLLEWVAYHMAVGFTDIIICSNDCVDGSPALLDRLQALGVIRHVPCSVGRQEKPQLVAYARAAEDPVLARADWVMVLDADEFLNINVGSGRLPDLINAVPEATAFLINWRIFGSSGLKHWSREAVRRRFTQASRRSDAINLSFKTLFTAPNAYSCPLSPHGPSHVRPKRLAGITCVDGAGEALPRQFSEARTFLQTHPERLSWKLAQVNHYSTRSWEDFVVKHQRGGGITRSWDRDFNWRAFDKNDEEDVSILAKLPAADLVLQELLADPKIARLHERCCELYGQHVEQLKSLQQDCRQHQLSPPSDEHSFPPAIALPDGHSVASPGKDRPCLSE